MSKSKIHRKWPRAVALTLAVVCAVVSLSGAGSFRADAASASELQNQLNQLEKKQSQITKEIQKTQNDKAKEQEYQKQLDSQIDVTQKQIDLLTKQLTVLNNDIAQKTKQIEAKEKEIEESDAQLRVRLRAMYMAEDDSMLSVLLGATDFADFLTKVDMVKRISQNDTALIKKLAAEKKEVEEKRASLVADKKQLDASKASLDAKTKQLEASMAKSQTEINRMKQAEAEYQKNKAQIDQQMEALEREIQAAIQQGQTNETYVGGELMWPLPGRTYISSYFEMRWGRMHKGIDIPAPAGTPIHAANDGTVIKAVKTYTPGYSYGMYVIIDHGGQKSTLYGHCSAVLVNVGDKVKRGDTIALVGNTGNSYGNHCHFEVRINGTATNPLNYVKR